MSEIVQCPHCLGFHPDYSECDCTVSKHKAIAAYHLMETAKNLLKSESHKHPEQPISMADEFNRIILHEITIHSIDLWGKSGRSLDWESGFLTGMDHLRKLLKQMNSTK